MSIINKLASFFNRRDKGDLKLFTEVVDETLTTLGKDVVLLELEYNLRTATGEWLDEWGSWFGVYRGMDEDDDSYRYRILTSLARATGTIPAIMNSVLEYYDVEYGEGKYTKDDISILEPYTLLKKFSECGDFSGIHRFPDAEYYRHHVVEITVPESVTPELRQMVNKTKAGGIQIYYKVSQDGGGNIIDMTPSTTPQSEMKICSDLEHAIVKYGKIRSKFVPPMSRMRSGRQILDTIETFIAMDFGFINGHTYKEISEFWKVMCQFGHTTPVWIPKVDRIDNVFSETLGTRSGDRNGHWEYHPVEEVFKDAEDSVLQLPVLHSRSFIKPARRSRCGNGHSMGYPRSGLEGEDFDFTQKEYVDDTLHVDAYWRMVDWSDTLVTTTLTVELEKPPTILVDKFFVTEHTWDEKHFDILSDTVEFSDAPYYSDVISFTDAEETRLQSTTQPMYTKTIMNVEDISLLSVGRDTTYHSEAFVDRHFHTGEEGVIGVDICDYMDMDVLVTTEHEMDELEFNTNSPTVNFSDGGYYANEMPYNEVINTITIQSGVVIEDIDDSDE